MLQKLHTCMYIVGLGSLWLLIFEPNVLLQTELKTAYIVDDLQLLLFEPNVTCMQGLEIHKTREYGPGGPGGDSIP